MNLAHLQSQTTPPWYQSPCKVWRKSVKNYLSQSSETTFLYQLRAITSLFINKFSPFAIPNCSSPISISVQSLMKTGQKLLNLESRNKAVTDTQNFWRVYHNTLPLFVWRGIKRSTKFALPVLQKLIELKYFDPDQTNFGPTSNQWYGYSRYAKIDWHNQI